MTSINVTIQFDMICNMCASAVSETDKHTNVNLYLYVEPHERRKKRADYIIRAIVILILLLAL